MWLRQSKTQDSLQSAGTNSRGGIGGLFRRRLAFDQDDSSPAKPTAGKRGSKVTSPAAKSAASASGGPAPALPTTAAVTAASAVAAAQAPVSRDTIEATSPPRQSAACDPRASVPSSPSKPTVEAAQLEVFQPPPRARMGRRRSSSASAVLDRNQQALAAVAAAVAGESDEDSFNEDGENILPNLATLGKSMTTSTTFKQEKSTASCDDEIWMGSLTLGQSFTSANGEAMPAANLPTELFEVPCHPLGVSGGTARFFKVKYVEPAPDELPDKFIGKDVARAIYEVEFYAALRREAAAASKAAKAWSNFSRRVCECPGVASLPCELPDKSAANRNLLILENFRSGFDKLRLCDIKIGEETAVANWKGKSWISAWSNSCVDAHTNSYEEGFRLEGMDCPPPVLEARLSAVTDGTQRAGYMRKQILGQKLVHRLVLQRLSARDFLSAWLDLSSLGPGYEKRTHESLLPALRQMTELVQVLAGLPWPQQWIGSSVGLGIEVGQQMTDEARVFVKLFDWGRSEVFNQEGFENLSIMDRKDCIRRWQQYIVACSRLHWELARIAMHRCCSADWSVVVFEVCLESTALMRALLQGSETVVNKRTEVVGFALVSLQQVQKLASDCVLPLSGASAKEPHQRVGTLEIRIEQENGKRGATTRRVHLKCAKLESEPAEPLFVRVIAFEDPDDATRHLKARKTGELEPMPCGHACAQTTAPGRQRGNSVMLDTMLEFIGLGEAAGHAQAKLQAEMSQCFKPSSPSSQRRRNPQRRWPEDLPPPFLSLPDARERTLEWAQRLVPWLAKEGGCPAAWRACHMYSVGDSVQVWSLSQKKWISAQVLETDLVELRYDGSDGLPVTKQLPAGHKHLRSAKGMQTLAYRVGDTVQVFSSSQNKWLQARVIDVDLVVVGYTGMQKQLPASHPHLRRFSTLKRNVSLSTTATSRSSQPSSQPTSSVCLDKKFDRVDKTFDRQVSSQSNLVPPSEDNSPSTLPASGSTSVGLGASVRSSAGVERGDSRMRTLSNFLNDDED